ncbi:MAG TPA: hypothetical protein VFE38_01305 [Edaphobacter sp.]|nr:hypothetical protein [Edaphobacter sp.]
MDIGWAHTGTSVIASFFASLVECVEALTVVLAVGSVRGWRSTLAGTVIAIALLLAIVAVLGKVLAHIPLAIIQFVVGTLLLLFGLRWLRKAILRSARLLPLHNEEAAFQKSSMAMRTAHGINASWDKVAFAAAFNITMLEGAEVVFIVIAIGAGSAEALLSASLGAAAALLTVIALGFMLHRPLARVPENTLKFAVGVLLSAFGTFWVGEGMHLAWPAADWSILMLVVAYFAVALLSVRLCRSQSQSIPTNAARYQ